MPRPHFRSFSVPKIRSRFRFLGTYSEGFSLIEIMVSMVVLLLLAGVVFSITTSTSKTWKNTTSKIESFQSARVAFESMTRNLSQATLNTYWDYFDANGKAVTSSSNTISKYGRNSELHFIVGRASSTSSGTASPLITTSLNWSQDGPTPPCRPTHAIFFVMPGGYLSGTSSSGGLLDRVLNASGYYVEFNSDKPDRPNFLKSSSAGVRFRYRLMQLIQPSDRLSVYDPSSAASKGFPVYNRWFNDALAIPPRGTTDATKPDSMPIADNVIALIIQPKRSSAETTSGSGTIQPLAPDYAYDSRNTVTVENSVQKLQRHQLPPFVQVTMVAIDESSAKRIENGVTPPDLVSTTAVGVAGYTGFADVSQFSSDLEKLTNSLARRRINYRVFSTNVIIKGAKWSEN